MIRDKTFIQDNHIFYYLFNQFFLIKNENLKMYIYLSLSLN